MEFYLMAKTYNSYGAHPTLSPIPQFLLQGAPDFGDGIKELTLTFHFATSGPAKKTLESIYEAHHRNRSSLPKIVFRRSKRKMTIDVASDLMDGRDWKRTPRLSLPLFVRAMDEVIAALTLMKSRLKSSDGFDVASFLAVCAASKSRIPSSEDDLQVLAEELESVRHRELDAMSPWEKLGIDWEDYHPLARAALDDPFFWESANDFAPHGNDTGADLLVDYRAWLRRNRDGSPMAFLEALVKRWGYSGLSEMDEHVRDEAAIALAFAEMKLRGSCDRRARDMAIKAVERQRALAQASSGWPHRDERLRTLGMIESKLREM